MNDRLRVYSVLVWVGIFVLLLLGKNAAANVEQIKVYKKVFPESKPQCIMCHIDKIPKKEDGKHELNAYGLKVKQTKVEMDAAPNEETYKKVGSAEEFEASQKTQ